MAEMNFDSDVAFPRLSEQQLAVLDAVGERRALVADEVLFGSGDRDSDFFVVLSGQVAIVDAIGTPAERVLGVHGEGRFVGELNLMSGEPAYLTALVREGGEAIVLSREALGALIGRDQQLGDLILTAFVARRAILVDAGSGVRLIGSSLSGESRRLREFLTRNRVPHSFIDLDGDRGPEQLLRELPFDLADLPLLMRGSTVLRNPTNIEAATVLNLRHRGKTAERAWDTLVVGAGPAGLGAAVYAGSEGLETVLVDAVALGGQASTSSRIENYLGFPAGISGSDLAERATLQARRFGVKTAVPERALSLTPDEGTYVLELDSGDRLRARTVVLATGASYRRLDVERVAEFEGAGVYYAATQMEAQACVGEPVAVVGGGNSAGQAAIFLAGRVSQVSLLLRGGDLSVGMSRYLVDQIERMENIEVLLRTEIREMHGGDSLQAITREENTTGSTSRVAAAAVFVFIGADPCTEWLDGALVTDEDGFILTGRELQLAHLDPATSGRQRSPDPLETSLPGVFAVGDGRSGSIKRVASAVGEGAMAVRLIHEHLASLSGFAHSVPAGQAVASPRT
ncbi:MAG TPA: FAD-dependent oxidoreductase [Solirubrobacterales bacterium]|jgi:thioredoxin reductase (NADPH)